MTFGELRFQLSKQAPGIDPDLLDGFINAAYEEILSLHAWKGLEADSLFQTLAIYTTGSIALTGASVAIVGTGTTWTAAHSGMSISMAGEYEPYVFTFADATHGTLDRPFEGSTDSGVAYTLWQDTYVLPADFRRPIQVTNKRQPRAGEIVHVSRDQADRIAPGRIVYGEPSMYSIVSPSDDYNTPDQPRAQLYPIPTIAAGYPFHYIRAVPTLTEGDTDVPILPWVTASALISLTRSKAEADKKNYNGALYYKKEAAEPINKMLIADAKMRGPQALRMAQPYTRHRVERALRGHSRDRSLLP